jgi:glycosyltransferase involved in cell wall biosynthesis
MTIPRENVFVIVAAYNEGRVLRHTVAPLLEQGYSVVVVDDGSADDTFAAARGLPVHCLRHAVNLGQGAALQTGMSYALQKGAEILVHFDADGQHSAGELPRFLRPIELGTADVVLGSRFHLAADASTVPASRRRLLRCAVLVNVALTGLWLTDAHNGFRAFSHSAAAKIDLRQNRYAHASEILSQIRAHRLRYVEAPTTVVYTDYSLAKGQSMWNAFNIVFDLLLGKLRQ